MITYKLVALTILISMVLLILLHIGIGMLDINLWLEVVMGGIGGLFAGYIASAVSFALCDEQ